MGHMSTQDKKNLRRGAWLLTANDPIPQHIKDFHMQKHVPWLLQKHVPLANTPSNEINDSQSPPSTLNGTGSESQVVDR